MSIFCLQIFVNFITAKEIFDSQNLFTVHVFSRQIGIAFAFGVAKIIAKQQSNTFCFVHFCREIEGIT